MIVLVCGTSTEAAPETPQEQAPLLTAEEMDDCDQFQRSKAVRDEKIRFKQYVQQAGGAEALKQQLIDRVRSANPEDVNDIVMAFVKDTADAIRDTKADAGKASEAAPETPAEPPTEAIRGRGRSRPWGTPNPTPIPTPTPTPSSSPNRELPPSQGPRRSRGLTAQEQQIHFAGALAAYEKAAYKKTYDKTYAGAYAKASAQAYAKACGRLRSPTPRPAGGKRSRDQSHYDFHYDFQA